MDNTVVNPAVVFVFILLALIPAIGSIIQYRKNYAVSRWGSIHNMKMFGSVTVLVALLVLFVPSI
tara:strand:+ start:1721 stop:1915 length:195 start_codon:yes stop_codon:yes gene_type:complete